LLGNWDKKGEADEQFLKMYSWDGENLDLVFEVDFYEEKLGRAHLMTFNSNALFETNIADEQQLEDGLADAVAVADPAH
jgi:selenium-binding protein 1